MDLNWILDMLTSPYMSLFFLFFIGYFCWHNVYDYNDLADAITAIGANEAGILIPNQQDINENLTAPPNITLRFIRGGSLNVGKYSIRNATYKWTQSPAAANEYYLELAGGGDPGLTEPPDVFENGTAMVTGVFGNLAIGEWDWGDNDTLGYRTVYVRIAGSADPDGKAEDYVEATYKVIINSHVEAGPFQIFKGPGTVVVDSYPKDQAWWGDPQRFDFNKLGSIDLHDRDPQAIVTFTIDDYNAIIDWDDLFTSKGIKVTAFPFTANMAANLTPWLALQTAGWEIGSHSKTHPYLTTLTEEQIEDEVGGSKALLESWGFNIVRNFCYPYGDYNNLVRKIVRKYYIGGAGDVTNDISISPFHMDEISRIDGDTLTLGQLTDYVDDAISSEGWMIVMLHAADVPKLTKIGDLIDYIQGKGIQILTMSDAEDLIGNLVESRYFRIGPGGEMPLLQNLLSNSEIKSFSASDANKGLCTLAYDTGDKGAGSAPSVGDACVGANGATGKVISYTTSGGDWDLGTAEGVLTLGACTGSWTDNEGLTFDGVETALVNGEAIGICNDPCNDDGTGDWTDPDSILAHGGDGFYTVTTDANNEKAYLTGLSFTEGKIYKVEAQLKDGTATPIDIELVSLNGATVEKASAKIDTTGSFVTYSLTFVATADTDGVGIRTPTSLAASNIQMRYFICYEITPCCTEVNAYGLDRWRKDTTLDIYRQHWDGGALTKDGSFYALKVVPLAASDYLHWNLVLRYKAEFIRQYAGRTITIGAWALAFTDSHARLHVDYNLKEFWSEYHTGGGNWEWLEMRVFIGSSSTQLRIGFKSSKAGNVDGSTIIYFSQPIVVFGSFIGRRGFIPRQGEWIQLEKAIPLTTLNNKTGFSDVAWAKLNIEEESDGMIPKGAKSLLIGASVNDSGSAGADCYLVFRKDPTFAEQLYFSPYGLANDTIHRGEGIIDLDENGDLGYKIVATNGNFDIPRLKVYAVKVTD